MSRLLAALLALIAVGLKVGLESAERAPALIREARLEVPREVPVEVREAPREVPVVQAVRACRGVVVDQLVHADNFERAMHEARCSHRVVSREDR